MNKETVDKAIRHEIELFKVYAIFIISLGTGSISLIFRSDFPENKIILFLFVIGVLIFIIFGFGFIQSFLKIRKLSKKLQA